jgi:hypothetical protein
VVGEVEEWEVTLHYQNAEGKIVDLTVRMVARTADVHTNAQVRAACWYAVIHGPAALRDWDVHAVDWVNTRPSGAVQEYHYEAGTASGPAEAFENAVGLFKTVGMGKLRVALVE